ncbi:MAG: helix-turn-helix transcriptional regulator [Epulopiscium sp.]|nr:helix-turn-helix transcriptional regulator [Candidatus Epulonipiscium sp.]
MKIGDKIRQLREEIDLERTELAKKIGVTYHALAKYETNERQPDYEILKVIADFFNVSTDYLLGRTNVRTPVYDNPSTLTKKENNSYNIDDLSPESKKELEKYIKLLKLKDEMDKTKDETSSTLEKNA